MSAPVRPRESGHRYFLGAAILVAVVVSLAVAYFVPFRPSGRGDRVSASVSRTVRTFGAEADARVSESEPTANFGTSERLRVDGGKDPERESYLRFAVTGLTSRLSSAKLRVYAYKGSQEPPLVYSTSNAWSETGITWAARPARVGRAVIPARAVLNGTWMEYDVLPLVGGDGMYSFVLAPTSIDGVDLYSREGSFPPMLVVTLGGGSPVASPTTRRTEHAVLLAAGDIASCESAGDEATAALLKGTPATIATLGDNVYEKGTREEYAECYDPSWGRVKSRTKPSAGNHEYATTGASGYYGYFRDAAGDPDEGYYSYDLGAWHVVVLNSNCSEAGGCGKGSPQEEWLRADLVAHRTTCTLAYWHHPRYSSGKHGDHDRMQAIWEVLYTAGADVVLSGHDHDYERFAPQNDRGRSDPSRGIRQFVVGTGGKDHYDFQTTKPNSEVRESGTFGVLKLQLHAEGYGWEFLSVAGTTFNDSGTDACH